MSEATMENTGGAKLPLLDRLSERFNPILVKEVRQALRGNYFRFTFWLTVSGGTVVSVGHIALSTATERNDGQEFFMMLLTCLTIAVLGLVPFFAFIAMGSEWEENTYDLLSLSNLKPRQIVGGKIYSSAVQTLLHFSAFGPFIVFAFLLQGVDLNAVAFLLGLVFFMSVGLSTVAISFSTISSKRFIRMFLLAALAAGLVIVISFAISIASSIIRSPQLVYESDFQQGVGVAALIVAWVVAFIFASALGRLAHSEENRSSLPRALALVGVLIATGGMIQICSQLRTSGIGWNLGQNAFITFMFAGVTLFILSMGFTTEPDRLGRRVSFHVPRSRLRAFLATPFLPGGTRGLVFFVLSALLLVFTLSLSRLIFGESPSDLFDTNLAGMLFAIVYGFIYLSIPQSLSSGMKALTPFAKRLLIPALFGFGIIVPSLLEFFSGSDADTLLEHVGNPAWVIERVIDGGWIPKSGELVLGGFFLLGALFSWRRIGRAFSEVSRASAEARERAARLETVVTEEHAAG